MRLPSIVVLLTSSLSVGLPAVPAVAHPGGLDANECHHNRKTGDYHCHRAGAASATSRSHRLVSSGFGRAFRNWAEARAAGAAPVRASDPGYARHLDRDGDGVACE